MHWASGNPANRDIRGRRVRSLLSEALPFLEPRFFNPDRGLLVGHASGWTAFFDNHSHQFAPAAELYVLALGLRKDHVDAVADELPERVELLSRALS